MLRLALVVILVVAVTVQISMPKQVESDSEANSGEAGPSSQVVSLLDRLKSPTLCGIMTFLKE